MDSLTQLSDDHQSHGDQRARFPTWTVQFPDDGPMVFEFDIEVRPNSDLPRWKGLTIERPTKEYTEADVEQRLRQLLSKYGHLEPSEGPIEAGDFATLTLRVSHDGRQLSQLTEETIEVQADAQFDDAKLEGFDNCVDR